MLTIRCSDEQAEHIKEYLTDTEKQVFDMRRAGKSRIQMAMQMHCSESAIRNRMRKVKRVIDGLNTARM